MDSSLSALLAAIDADKAMLDGERPLPVHTLASLREAFLLEWTYHSNALEGNTLTFRETQVALEGLAVGGKTLREHFEVLNHRDAMLYVEELVGKNEALSESQIQHIHGLLVNNIDEAEAGHYRRGNASSAWAPDFTQVPAEMANLIDWRAGADAVHPVMRAAELHARFAKIHPFADCNGQTGRLMLNLDLMKSGYPPAVLLVDERVAYHDALGEASAAGDFRAIGRLVAEAVQRTLKAYLEGSRD